MKVLIPVYSRLGPKIQVTEDGAYVKNLKGDAVWMYQAKKVTGKGIFVAACARAATVYMTKVLQSLGYDIGHEKEGVDGSVGYHLVVIKPKNCFHQVRHPLNQIASMKEHRSWGFMQHVIDINGTGLYGCMQYWLFWNELIEKCTVWRYRVEDLPNVWDEFLERINHEKCELPDIPTNINSHKHDDLTWADLFNKNRELAQRIRDKCMEYGYSAELPQGQSEADESWVAEKVQVACQA